MRDSAKLTRILLIIDYFLRILEKLSTENKISN